MPAEKLIQFPIERKPKKKPKGRRRDGLVARHFRYTDLHGVARRKTVYGRTVGEAEQKKRDYLAAVDLSLRMDQQSRTVESWVDEWLAVYKKPHVTQRTYETYARDAALIKMAIGKRPLRTITSSDLQAIINARKGLSASAIKKTAMTVRAIFQLAVENKILAASPAVGIKAIKGPSGTHRSLEEGERLAILGAAESLCIRTRARHRFSLAAMLMMFAGLRRGECAALDLSRDVDLAAGTITVREAVSWISNQGQLKTPKSRAGFRTIPIFAPLLPCLQERTSGLALTGVRYPDNHVSETAFNAAHHDFMRLCGVKFTPHDLRHTYATMLYDAGVDVKTAQLWLGHDDPTVTLRIYTHLSNSRCQASTASAADYFSQYSGGKNGGNSSGNFPEGK